MAVAYFVLVRRKDTLVEHAMMANSSVHVVAAVVAQVTAQATQQQARGWYYFPISGPEATVAAGVLASLIVVIGWIVVHRTTLRREREARAEAARIAREDRLRAFECFLVEREQLTEAMRPEDIHNAYYTPQGILSSTGFRREAAAVRRDFKLIDRPEFNRLDEALSRIPPQQLQADANRTSRDTLADAIRALLAFVQRA